MPINLSGLDLNNTSAAFSFPHYPDTCPRCLYAVTPDTPKYVYFDTNKTNEIHYVQAIFRCPRLDCQNLFIALYRRTGQGANYLALSNCIPLTKRPKIFSDIIQKLSSEFCEIYNQSLAAEGDGLLKICGVGYRKSLEFLIKDFLIKSIPDKKDEIIKTFLGKCIEDYVSNANIKAAAKRATWLGNDETHYIRLWESKDLSDLKKLIDLTVHWIEMEQLTKDITTDMPETKK